VIKAKLSIGKSIAKVSKPRIPISPAMKKVHKAISSSSRKKQSAKLLKIPALKAIKKYVKKQAKSSFIPKVSVVTPPIQPPISQESQRREIFIDDTNIPTSYEKTWIALIVKDPHWVYATWEISQNSLYPFLSRLEDSQYPSRIILRVYDVTCIQFNGTNANYYFDLEVGRSANNWYIHLWMDHASYCAEIGVRAFDGTFTPLARSNFVQTPRSGHSWRTEQIWMEVKDHETHSPYVVVRIRRNNASLQQSRSTTIRRKFYLSAEDIRGYYAQLMPFLRNVLSARWGRMARKGARLEGNDLDRNEIYRLAGEEFFEEITAGASEILVGRGKRGALGASEHLISSQPPENFQKQRKFFFEIWADVIVYGRTESDAEVWLGDQKIPLRPDGTFTLRNTLPDTTISLPFTAVSGDKLEKREIATTIRRQTKYSLPNISEGSS